MADRSIPWHGIRRPRLRLWHVLGGLTVLSWTLVALVAFLLFEGFSYVWRMAF